MMRCQLVARRLFFSTTPAVLRLFSAKKASSLALLSPAPLATAQSSLCRGREFSYWAKHSKEAEPYDAEQLAQWREAFPSLKEFTDQAVFEWRRVFDLFDRDSDGWISNADLQKRPEFSFDKALKIKRFDRDRNNLIDFGEFVEGLYELDKEMLHEAFEGFTAVDVQLEFEKFATTDAQGKKRISLSGVAQLMRSSRFTCVTETDAQRLLREMDADGDGSISLSDFQEWARRSIARS